MTLLQRTLWFIAMLLLQVLVCNHIHILGYAIPMPFIYALLILHSATPRWVYVIMGFALGILIDIPANTIGEYASTTTFVALLTPWLLSLCAPPDRSEEAFAPSARTMKWGGFLRFAIVVTLLQTTLFFIIENFSFFHWHDMLLDILSSTVITVLIISAIEHIRISFKKK